MIGSDSLVPKLNALHLLIAKPWGNCIVMGNN